MGRERALMNGCPTGKHPYATEQDARDAMRVLRKKGVTELRNVYLCSRCDHWHLTSKRQKAGRTR